MLIAIQSAVVGIVGSAMCGCGRHDSRPFRSLTRRSREFRCIRCEKRYVEVMEEWIQWPLRGGRPYGEGPDSIGEKIAWRGLNVDGEKADQTPYPSWRRSREGWLAHSGSRPITTR